MERKQSIEELYHSRCWLHRAVKIWCRLTSDTLFVFENIFCILKLTGMREKATPNKTDASLSLEGNQKYSNRVFEAHCETFVPHRDLKAAHGQQKCCLLQLRAVLSQPRCHRLGTCCKCSRAVSQRVCEPTVNCAAPCWNHTENAGGIGAPPLLALLAHCSQ